MSGEVVFKTFINPKTKHKTKSKGEEETQDTREKKYSLLL